jgi:hypothetical protein
VDQPEVREEDRVEREALRLDETLALTQKTEIQIN